MAEILQKAYQKAIDEQGEMVYNTSQNTPTIDSVIGTGPDIIQPPKIEVKEVFSHEEVDSQEGSATEAKVPESKQGTSPVISIAAELNTSKSPVEDPEFTVAVDAQSKSSNKSSDATVLMSVQANKSLDASAVEPVKDSKSDGSAEGSVEENQSSDASAVESVEESK
jgi:hypothetical protein